MLEMPGTGESSGKPLAQKRRWAGRLFGILAVLSGAAGGLGLWVLADPSGWGALPAIALARIGLPLSLAGLPCWAVWPRRFALLSWPGLALLVLPWVLLARLTG